MGTGGTLTGNGRRLHEHDPNIQVIAAEPELGDLVYGLRSLDDGFVPPIFDPTRGQPEVPRELLRRAADEPRAHGEGGHLRRDLVGRGRARRAAHRDRRSTPATSSACSPTADGSTCPPRRGPRTSRPPRRASRSRSGGSPVVSDPRPIGVFDSGVGGLTVARAILDLLPHEPLIYVGDSARFPYGPKPVDEIRRYAIDIADYLVHRDVKMLVVACNSVEVSRSRGHRGARGHPGGRRDRPGHAHRRPRHAQRRDRADRDGGHRQERRVRSRGRRDRGAPVTLHSQACPAFVEHVERGDTTSDALRTAARGYLVPLVERGIDTLILGCTHYPLLSGLLQLELGPDVVLVSSAEETAKDVYATLLAIRPGARRAGCPRPRVPLDRRPRAVPTPRRGLPRSRAPRGARRPGPTRRRRLVELTVLGSSGTWPGPGRATCGYLLSHEGAHLWLDAGSRDVLASAAVDPRRPDDRHRDQPRAPRPLLGHADVLLRPPLRRPRRTRPPGVLALRLHRQGGAARRGGGHEGRCTRTSRSPR